MPGAGLLAEDPRDRSILSALSATILASHLRYEPESRSDHIGFRVVAVVAAKLRFRTEDDKWVRLYRKSVNSRDKREKGSWLGSKDSNLDSMIQIHEPSAKAIYPSPGMMELAPISN